MESFDLAAIIQRIAIFMPAFLLALVVHEYAHAWMAARFGDQTSAWNGRLTLNPAAHIDPFGTIVFPLVSISLGAGIFFGWAKPVPIDTRQFSNYRKGLFWVSFAGPLSNIILGVFTAFALVAFLLYVPESFGLHRAFSEMLKALIGINFALAIFNLLPIPPLDGSNMVLSQLGYEATRKFLVLQQYSFFILLFLMFSGALRIIGIPIEMLYNFSIHLAAMVFGLPSLA